MIVMNRRNLITGLVSLIAAPAIVRAGSLMPVKLYDLTRPDLWTIKVRVDGLTYYRILIVDEDGLIKYGEPWRPI